VYDTPKPLSSWVFDNRTPAEKQSKQILLNWLYKLGQLYGQVYYPAEVHEFMNDRLRKISSGIRVNPDPRLDTYYQRYQLHMQKALMAVHFSHSLELEVTLEDAEKAVKLLEDIERPMSKCFVDSGRNEVAGVGENLWRKMLKVDGRALTEKQVRAMTFLDIKNEFEFAHMITGLVNQGKLIEGMDPFSKTKMYQAQEV
jgi:hypothetical protein